MDMNSTQDSIQVFIRVRPSQLQQSALAFTQTQIKLQKHQFAFDKIFDAKCTQNDIFQHVGNKLLTNVMDGYNSCVFVYGQTGSGKTHTMIGQNNGLMQQSFNQLFSRINRLKNADCLVTCSYFQLYNEQIMDLLDPKKDKKLNIRQDAKRGVFVENLSQETAFDCDKLMEVLYAGMKNRHIGETQMNRQSSRSHSVFTISLSCKIQEDGKKILKTPKLHFVDLAGSERQKMTQASGQRLKQAGNINKSLTTLGMVINNLTSQKPRTHIPYRDSKLTCLLRDSLGGNSKTIIIATVSTALLSFQQTLSTLNFANRAKMVKVKAQINQESLSSNIQVFKQQIRRLKTQIQRLRSEPYRSPVRIIHQQVSPKRMGMQLEQHFQQINKKISAISDQISQGIVSPSLQVLLSKLNKTSNFQSKMQLQNNCMQDEQSQLQDNHQKYNSEFIQYLNSNYQLLSQINTKVNQYLVVKDQLRSSAINRKLTIQNVRTPSKFQRDQYQQLLNKRQDQIRFLQQKLQTIQTSFNCILIEKKDLQRKLNIHKDQKGQNIQSINKFKQNLLQLEQQLEISKGIIQRLKSQLVKSEKTSQQLQIRLKQTKQLYLYSQQKYQNQKFTSSKLTSRIQSFQQQILHIKKQTQNYKDEIKEMQNEIQKLKLIIQDKQSLQDQLRNQFSQIQETLQFNKKIINDLTKKSTSTTTQLLKQKQTINQLEEKNKYLVDQKQVIKQSLQRHQKASIQIMQQKSSQLKQIIQTNDRLLKEISQLSTRLNELSKDQQIQVQRSRSQISQLRFLNMQKQTQLNNMKNQFYQLEERVNLTRNQKEGILQNYSLKLQAKIIQINMLQANFHQYQRNNQNYVEQIKKQMEISLTKNNSLETQVTQISQQNFTISTQLKEAQNKLGSVNALFQENDQLKKSYKQLVKENYRLKGKYKNVQNQELEKQKNQQLLSKVQYYQQKFNLMSIEYQKFSQIVKKLKQKQLQNTKKIEFYQQNIRLSSMSCNDTQQRSELIKQLKQQNRQLKSQIDNLSCNTSASISTSPSVKQQKFRQKLIHLMKKWDGFDCNNQYSTEQIMELTEKMINQNMVRFQTIAKGIRRQQKLKAQNHFILKQNIYLKDRVQIMEKTSSTQKLQNDPKQVHSKPRKLIKSD